jgi:lysine-N-methylase
MKVNVFQPKYMLNFKCISSSCIDTCCAGWDINIDEATYNNYINSTGKFKELLEGKFIKNKDEHDSFNNGFMVLKDESRCPFLNCSMLCDIHGGFGEKNLCITCKSYPRVFNIVDDVYEKSGLPSCIEICTKAFLSKEKMEFVESEEDIEEKNIEIRRIVDSEAFDGTESLLQFFWDIRVISINIIQLRSFSIEERLNILKNFYEKIEKLYKLHDFDRIEELLEEFSSESIDYESLKGIKFKENNEFYMVLAEDELIKNIKSSRLRECIKEYKAGISNQNNLYKYLEVAPKYFNEFEKYFYVLENYLVNQIFKDLIPFNKGENLMKSIRVLINSYRIVKAYVIGIAISCQEEIREQQIIRIIQALSKEIEHNKVFKKLLEK